MLINYFDEDYQSLMKYLEEKCEVQKFHDDSYTTFYFRKKESDNKDYYPHIKIFNYYGLSSMKRISEREWEQKMNQSLDSLEEEVSQLSDWSEVEQLLNSPNREVSWSGVEQFLNSLKREVSQLSKCSEVGNGIFLLQVDCCIINKPLLLKSNLLYNGKRSYGYIRNTLELEIKQYSRLYNVEQNNIRLSLIRLFGFERLKFNSDDLEKYIQLKNKELSRCTEEELNKQAEKFINPHNYPHYFKNEVFACLGAETVKRIGTNAYSKAANKALNSRNPDTSLQSLQISALAAIGKFARQVVY
ncbi:MAG: hypothetical protein sL5_08920 [Candidatus Mesenet longicola]|uniref:Uncharacterized protein n=1 Tax=Candidatus Mesenet longicola TaxID=1892558 RepID=A0A8J3MMF9_9RICK|nr:MAG: hypothetical protein sGL2_04260 [Candidatus Mesenet longicola]GHM59899.1 MAG: hypothetical protein sL5_08920 [Candidatus Mesenet longicola]